MAQLHPLDTVTPTPTPPAPPGYPRNRVMHRIRRDPLRCLSDVATQYGDVAYVGRTHAQPCYVLSHPEYVKYVLQDNQENYRCGAPAASNLVPSWEHGGSTHEQGAQCLSQRLVQPVLQGQHLGTLTTMITETIAAELPKWSSLGKRGEPLDVVQLTAGLNLRLVGQTMFGTDMAEATSTLQSAMQTVLAYQGRYQSRSVMGLPIQWPTLKNWRYRTALRTLHRCIADIIQRRYRGLEDRGDVLSLLMRTWDADTGYALSPQQVQNEAFTLFVSGYETLTSVLTWTWYLLAKHPHVAATMREEVDTVLDGLPPTRRDLARLPYMDMVFHEALRLYPPTWLMTRTCLADDEIGGYSIPANACVLMSPYVLQRHPEVWENPHAFKPTRFFPRPEVRHPYYAYLPFGSGPRVPLSRHLTLLQSMGMVAMVTQAYDLDLVSWYPVALDPASTLRPRRGVLMMLHERQAVSRVLGDAQALPFISTQSFLMDAAKERWITSTS